MKKDGQDKTDDKIQLLNRNKGFALIYTLSSLVSVLLLTYIGPLKNRQASNYQFKEQKVKAMAAQSQSVHIKYESSNHIFWLNRTHDFTNF